MKSVKGDEYAGRESPAIAKDFGMKLPDLHWLAQRPNKNCLDSPNKLPTIILYFPLSSPDPPSNLCWLLQEPLLHSNPALQQALDFENLFPSGALVEAHSLSAAEMNGLQAGYGNTMQQLSVFVEHSAVPSFLVFDSKESLQPYGSWELVAG